MIVGPTWMSLICAIVKPCSAVGQAVRSARRPRTTRGGAARVDEADQRRERGEHRHRARRARANASSRARPAPTQSTPASAASSTTSRSSVSTNSDENRPISEQADPGQRVGAAGRRRAGDQAERQQQRRGQQHAPSSRPASGGRSRPRRSPTYACSSQDTGRRGMVEALTDGGSAGRSARRSRLGESRRRRFNGGRHGESCNAEHRQPPHAPPTVVRGRARPAMHRRSPEIGHAGRRFRRSCRDEPPLAWRPYGGTSPRCCCWWLCSPPCHAARSPPI